VLARSQPCHAVAAVLAHWQHWTQVRLYERWYILLVPCHACDRLVRAVHPIHPMAALHTREVAACTGLPTHSSAAHTHSSSPCSPAALPCRSQDVQQPVWTQHRLGDVHRRLLQRLCDHWPELFQGCGRGKVWRISLITQVRRAGAMHRSRITQARTLPQRIH
jgi:hypothetical protein